VKFCTYIYLTLICSLLLVISVFAQQELKICAIRVEFQEDQNDLTTGNGLFNYDTIGITPFTIDPPPHDRSYFQDQIIAVKNYFLAASKGKLNISGTVYPAGNDLAYRLPNDMGFYNPNTTEEENNLQLAQLFTDAIIQADADITFDEFDLVTIFHAGVGRDIDLGFDATPQDIPSLYLSPSFFKTVYGIDFNGISVDGGQSLVNRGIILPETESQEDLEIAVTGIFASNIGTHLGLFDLFSSSTQSTGIGRFGIMDAGLFNLFGLAPAMPSAFSRELAGWDIPEQINIPSDNLIINRFEGERTDGTSIYNIAINSDEYFLIEYRGDSQVNIDSLFVVLSEGRLSSPTYLEVLKTFLSDRILVSDSTGVLLNIENYDWGLPGAGILIWHIDESVIALNAESNTVNDNDERRGVDVEEADGSQDIGFSYSIVEPGFQSELGTWLDFWFADNPAPLYQNEFSGKTSPNSKSNDNFTDSHIILEDFSSNNSSRMNFSYKREYFETGFPLNLTDAKPDADLVTAVIETLNKSAILTSDDKGKIFAITQEGMGLFTDNRWEIAKFEYTDLVGFALADTNNNSQVEILVAAFEKGIIKAFLIEDSNNDYNLDSLFSIEIDGRIVNKPVIQNPFFYIGLEDGRILRYSFNGELDSTYFFSNEINSFTVISPQEIKVITEAEGIPDFSPIVVDLDGDGNKDFISYPSQNSILIETSNHSGEINLTHKLVGSPAVVDFDNDGFYEIIFNSAEAIFAFKLNGALMSNFPIYPDINVNENLVGTPLILDVNGNNKSNVVVNSSEGLIYTYDQEGNKLLNIQFSSGGRLLLSSAAADLDNDGFVELFSINEKGDLFGWQLDSQMGDNVLLWPQSLYNFTNNSFIDKRLVPEGLDVTDLLPKERVYNYPNPNETDFTNIRYYLREDASVSIKIYDLAGDLVENFHGPGMGKIDNEIRWDLSSVASGVYICRIEAKSKSMKDVRLIKIMVVN
jgi:M6 family metalloprotease-like protein